MSVLGIARKLVHRRYRIRQDIDLPTELIAEGKIDSNSVYMEGLYSSGQEKIICYAAGIGDQIDFELDLINRLKAKGKQVELYAFDPTPATASFIQLIDVPKDFHFYPYALSDSDGEMEFALPRKEGWVSGTLEQVINDERELDFTHTITVKSRSLKSLMQEFGHDRIDLLKMDIEGSEFPVLEKALDDKCQIEQMCVDHHEHMFRGGRDKLKRLECQLRESGYLFYYVEKDDALCRNFSCIRTDRI